MPLTRAGGHLLTRSCDSWAPSFAGGHSPESSGSRWNSPRLGTQFGTWLRRKVDAHPFRFRSRGRCGCPPPGGGYPTPSESESRRWSLSVGAARLENPVIELDADAFDESANATHGPNKSDRREPRSGSGTPLRSPLKATVRARRDRAQDANEGDGCAAGSASGGARVRRGSRRSPTSVARVCRRQQTHGHGDCPARQPVNLQS
jgi:hypothetical protein